MDERVISDELSLVRSNICSSMLPRTTRHCREYIGESSIREKRCPREVLKMRALVPVSSGVPTLNPTTEN